MDSDHLIKDRRRKGSAVGRCLYTCLEVSSLKNLKVSLDQSGGENREHAQRPGAEADSIAGADLN